jgi:hypothetical protein
MKYKRIAELVHELVKNPNSILSQEFGLPREELKTNEFESIRRVFSKKIEVSGDALRFETTPFDFW